MSTADALRAAMAETAALPPVEVPVPGPWGTVFVKLMTAEEVSANMQANTESGDTDEGATLARGAARVICDETGALIFDAKNADDLALLRKQPWKMLRVVIAKANEINALTDAAQAEAGNA